MYLSKCVIAFASSSVGPATRRASSLTQYAMSGRTCAVYISLPTCLRKAACSAAAKHGLSMLRLTLMSHGVTAVRASSSPASSRRACQYLGGTRT
eukprot:3047060-Heterocapsa_arctica.AAC.1